MHTRKFLNSEDSIFFSPRLCARESNSETWLFPHMDLNGKSYNNLIHILFNDDCAKIVIFSEDELLEKNEIHITKIINLIHDVYSNFSIQYITVNNVYDIDMKSEINKLN